MQFAMNVVYRSPNPSIVFLHVLRTWGQMRWCFGGREDKLQQQRQQQPKFPSSVVLTVLLLHLCTTSRARLDPCWSEIGSYFLQTTVTMSSLYEKQKRWRDRVEHKVCGRDKGDAAFILQQIACTFCSAAERPCCPRRRWAHTSVHVPQPFSKPPAVHVCVQVKKQHEELATSGLAECTFSPKLNTNKPLRCVGGVALLLVGAGGPEAILRYGGSGT